MTYLCKFNEHGERGETYPVDDEMSREARQEYVDAGFVEISESEWRTYVNSVGENGTGYIRDPKTGKPVSAPPAPPVETTEEPTANVPETELAVMEGMVDMQSRIAALEAELAKLKGGQ